MLLNFESGIDLSNKNLSLFWLNILNEILEIWPCEFWSKIEYDLCITHGSLLPYDAFAYPHNYCFLGTQSPRWHLSHGHHTKHHHSSPQLLSSFLIWKTFLSVKLMIFKCLVAVYGPYMYRIKIYLYQKAHHIFLLQVYTWVGLLTRPLCLQR